MDTNVHSAHLDHLDCLFRLASIRSPAWNISTGNGKRLQVKANVWTLAVLLPPLLLLAGIYTGSALPTWLLCLVERYTAKIFNRCSNTTPCLKKTSHLWLAVTLTHMNGFSYFFGRNVTDKVGNQKTLYYATSNNLCFCTTWQNTETWKSHISLNWIVLHTQCTYALSSWKKKIVICDVLDSVKHLLRE